MSTEKQKAVCFFSRSGAGKGTQATLLAERLGWPVVSTGDLIRAEAKMGTALGERCRQILEEGKFLSAGDAIELDLAGIQQYQDAAGLIFEGSPRSGEEARFLADQLDAKFLWVDVLEDVCRKRLIEVRQRGDDTQENIDSRFREFDQAFVGVSAEVELVRINGDRYINDVVEEIDLVLNPWL